MDWRGQETMLSLQCLSDMSSDCPHLGFRYTHGGTGCGSAHKPILASRASFSNPSSTVSPGAYFRYHQL
jgi:hypothetical protein